MLVVRVRKTAWVSVFVTLTMAPEITAPVLSATVPRIVPVISCASPTAVRASAHIKRATDCNHDFFWTSINLLILRSCLLRLVSLV